MGKGGRAELIKKEIERTGFPLEIEISTLLEEDNWTVLSSSHYFDKDESEWGEIDIKASHHDIDFSYNLFVSMIDAKMQGIAIEAASPWLMDMFLLVLVFDGKTYSWIDGEVKEESHILLEADCFTHNLL